MATRHTTESTRNDTDTIRTPGMWANQVRAFAERNLREIMRSRIMLFWVFGFPPAMYLLYTVMMGNGDIPPARQASFALGIGMFGAILVCLYVFGNQLVTDVENHRYAAFRALPISPSADLAGRMLVGLVLAFCAFLSTFAAAALTGASFGLRGVESIPVVLAAGVLSCVLWMVVAIPIVAVADSERYAEFITTGLATGAFVLTGFNGVVPAVSPLGTTVLNYLPNALPTRLLAYHLIDTNRWAEIGLAPATMPTNPAYLGLLLVYTVVFLVVGAVVLNKALYKRGSWR